VTPEEDDLRWMRLAYEEALLAAEENEVPVGAVVVVPGRILGRGHNRTEALQDPTAHAEILAVTAAANTLGTWRLEGATVYVTLEPCLMCAGAIFLARAERLVYATADPKRGVLGSVIDVSQNEALNHHTHVSAGPLEAECRLLLSSFFEKLRRDARTP
jgi:tRNA(adenine34) deaminase